MKIQFKIPLGINEYKNYNEENLTWGKCNNEIIDLRSLKLNFKWRKTLNQWTLNVGSIVFIHYFFWFQADALYKQCIIFLYLVSFDLINKQCLMDKILSLQDSYFNLVWQSSKQQSIFLFSPCWKLLPHNKNLRSVMSYWTRIEATLVVVS
jgi:hypothetical protein